MPSIYTRVDPLFPTTCGMGRFIQEFSTPPAYSQGNSMAPKRALVLALDILARSRLSISGPCQTWKLCAAGRRCARSWGSFCRYVRRRALRPRQPLCIRARSCVGPWVPALYVSGPSPSYALGAYSVGTWRSLSRIESRRFPTHPARGLPAQSRMTPIRGLNRR